MPRCTIFLLLVSTCLGCSTSPPLNKWVEERGYRFHRDYSSIDTLGWEVDRAGDLSSNQTVKAIEPKKGEIPDFSQSQNSTFHIEGKAATQKFLKQIVEVEASAEYDKIYSAEIELIKPYKFQATALLPT